MKVQMCNCFKVIALLVLAFVTVSESVLQCYKCLVAPPTFYQPNQTIHLCEDFDYSDKFIVDCPYSTFCMKKITSAKIPIPINGTERDCASQKSETQNYKNGHWQPEVTVEEAYVEGCSVVKDQGQRTSTIENCYCKGALCNGAGAHQRLYLVVMTIISTVTVILVLY